MMDNDNITAEDQPDVFIQADLSDFAAMGISILSAAQAAAAQTGAAVEVFVDGITEGFADGRFWYPTVRSLISASAPST